MDKRKIELLEQMTVANGASPNEEAIARRKIEQYAAAMSKPKKEAISIGEFWKTPDSEKPLHEQMFLKKWYKLKADNRKRWKA